MNIDVNMNVNKNIYIYINLDMNMFYFPRIVILRGASEDNIKPIRVVVNNFFV